MGRGEGGVEGRRGREKSWRGGRKKRSMDEEEQGEEMRERAWMGRREGINSFTPLTHTYTG